MPFCKECFQCRSGATNLCAKGLKGIGLQMPGAFAQSCSVSEDMLYLLPPRMDFASGALVEPAAVIFHSIRRSGIGLGDSAIILGAGPLGLMAVKYLKNMGISPLVVIEPDPPRARLATDFGADHVFTKEVDRQFLQNLFGVKGGSDVIFECSGTGLAISLGLELVRPRGKVVLVGVSRIPLEILMRPVVTKEIDLLGVLAYTTDFQQAIQILERGVISPKEFVTEIVPLKEIEAAFRRCLGQGKPLKVLIEPNKS
jgi:2-desacetyl-2-hydroxyethyl bacteriochlorophyllide A dehydrogenase